RSHRRRHALAIGVEPTLDRIELGDLPRREIERAAGIEDGGDAAAGAGRRRGLLGGRETGRAGQQCDEREELQSGTHTKDSYGTSTGGDGVVSLSDVPFGEALRFPPYASVP